MLNKPDFGMHAQKNMYTRPKCANVTYMKPKLNRNKNYKLK